ncbi:MAG: small nuclear ribonucleoprotein Sm D3 [Cyphobasidiales sp. Tagirdzhanova-0007]|nr:MAG: small nuclear ribonucleoprotein Sm D3 [Cyphobasidiales sp. Tagirdzhanova-0007]
MSTIGVPTKLLQESLGHVVTIELKTGQVYRGKLFEAEDNLNVSLKDITVTQRDGRVSQLDQVYIRGPMIRFYIVPDMLANAPMFKRIGANAMKGRGIGSARGRATIQRAARDEAIEGAVARDGGGASGAGCKESWYINHRVILRPIVERPSPLRAIITVDAVRYSVPAILQSLSSSSRNADSHVLNYKAKINKANTSIDELEHGASALQDALENPLSQELLNDNKPAVLTRIRRNPYTHRRTLSSEPPALAEAVWQSALYLSTITAASVAYLNERINTIAAKIPAIEVSKSPLTENKRVFTISIKATAKFYVFLCWNIKSGYMMPTLTRVNVVAISEDKRSYELSDYVLWREVSLQVTAAFKRHCHPGAVLDVECLLARTAARSATTPSFTGYTNRPGISRGKRVGRTGGSQEFNSTMRLRLTEITINFTTFLMSLFALGDCKSLASGHISGLERHLSQHVKRGGVQRMNSESSQATGPHNITLPLPPAIQNDQHLDKRSFYGQGTYFYPGQGACGWTATSKDHIAALNKDQYGDVSQESPHCGHYIWITNTQTGASTRAQVQDACPGCNYGDLDLSPAAFDDLAPESQGVVQIE